MQSQILITVLYCNFTNHVSVKNNDDISFFKKNLIYILDDTFNTDSPLENRELVVVGLMFCQSPRLHSAVDSHNSSNYLYSKCHCLDGTKDATSQKGKRCRQ